MPKRALALKYTKSLPAPFLLAKGSGAIASAIVRIASEHDIVISEDAVLTEALYPLEIGSLIPEEYYEVVAAIFAWLATMKEKK